MKLSDMKTDGNVTMRAQGREETALVKRDLSQILVRVQYYPSLDVDVSTHARSWIYRPY